jgi:hypothetical protein
MAEEHNMGTRTEQVVLDIGGDIGALILYTNPEANGAEIEISPHDHSHSQDHDDHHHEQGGHHHHGHRAHNQVHERNFNGRVCFAAVYPELQAGEYDLWGEGDDPVDHVTIVGGQVAELDWR